MQQDCRLLFLTIFVTLLLLLYQQENDTVIVSFLYFHLSFFHSLNFSLTPSLSALSCHYVSTSLHSLLPFSFPSHCKYGDLVNKPLKPHHLCSLITHAIFTHGCHSCKHINGTIYSLLSSSHSFCCSPTLIS